MRFIFITLFIFLHQLAIYGQIADIEKMDLQKVENQSKRVVGSDQNGNIFVEPYQLLQYSLNRCDIEVYSSETGTLKRTIPVHKKKWKKELKFEQRQMEIFHGAPYMIVSNKKGVKKRWFAVKVDEHIDIIGDPIDLGKDDVGMFQVSSIDPLFIQKSPKHTLFVVPTVLKKSKSKEFLATVLYKNGSIERFSFTIDEKFVHNPSFKLVNESILVECETTNTQIGWNNGDRFLYIVNTAGKMEAEKLDLEALLGDYELGQIEFANLNGQTIVFGINYSNSIPVSYFSAFVDIKQGELLSHHQYELSKEIINDIGTLNNSMDNDGKKKGESNSLDGNFKPTELIKTSDGGVLMIFQKDLWKLEGEMMWSNTRIDALIIKINMDGEQEWIRFIPMFHPWESFEMKRGYKYLVKDDNVYFLHGRRVKKHSSRTEVVLTRLTNGGEMKQQEIVDSKGDDLNFKFSVLSIATFDKAKRFIEINKNWNYFGDEKCQVIFINPK